MDVMPACLPARGLKCQGPESDEGVHVQLCKVFNGLHQVSRKYNLGMLTFCTI
jgi:hypothetical protein